MKTDTAYMLHSADPNCPGLAVVLIYDAMIIPIVQKVLMLARYRLVELTEEQVVDTAEHMIAECNQGYFIVGRDKPND